MSHIIKRKETALLHLKKGYDFRLTRYKNFWDKKDMFFDAVTILRNPAFQANTSKKWANEWCWDTEFVVSIFDKLWSQTRDTDKPRVLGWLAPYLPEEVTSSPRFLKLVVLGDSFLDEYLTGQAYKDYVDMKLEQSPRADLLMKVHWLFKKYVCFTPARSADIVTLMERLMTVPDSLLDNRADCIDMVRKHRWSLAYLPSLRDDIDFAIDLYSANDRWFNPCFSYRLRKIVQDDPPRIALERYKLETTLSHKPQTVKKAINKI